MNKITKRIFMVLTLLVVGIGLVACGDKKVEVVNQTGAYASNAEVKFMSAYPNFTYKQATFMSQELDVFSNGTYELTLTETHFSGELLFPNEGEHSVIPRGVTITKYFGTQTTVEEDGLKTISLSSPTRVIKINTITTTGANYSLDTANWSEEEAAKLSEEVITMEQFLNDNKFKDVSILVNSATSSFVFDKLEK